MLPHDYEIHMFVIPLTHNLPMNFIYHDHILSLLYLSIPFLTLYVQLLSATDLIQPPTLEQFKDV